jgi:lipopolysaccharide transport system ATP-binding protein
MRDIAVRVEGLGKQYHIGGTQAAYKTVRESLIQAAKTPFRRLSSVLHGRSATASSDTIWALRDVDLEIERGKVVGIIGRNGAGKSTLLKILSRITRPSEGRVRIRGRVGSLLEVGTGFHPELTGRENVYLNGAILGMHKAEIERKYDEIVAFAEVEKFLGTPVKFYSSGMRVRLAFAVAAHLEPEILLVDEVLAVGDAAFQRKCLGKMGDVTQQGRTVLFVSHNMAAVTGLCSEAYVLDQGRLVYSGDVTGAVDRYTQAVVSQPTVALDKRKDRGGDGSVRLTSLSVKSAGQDSDRSIIKANDQLSIQIGYRAAKAFKRPRFSISVYNQRNVRVYRLDSEMTGELPDELPALGQVTCVTEPLNIAPGQYTMNVAAYVGSLTIADHLQHACSLTVEPVDFYGTGKLPQRQASGVCLIGQTWSSEQ